MRWLVDSFGARIFSIFSEAENTRELKARIPQVLDIVREFASRLQKGDVPIENLVITRSLSKNPNEYSHRVPQAIAAALLKTNGGTVHAGQQIRYILTLDMKNNETTATAPELAEKNTVFASGRYIDLLISSTANLLLPLGYDKNTLTRILRREE